MKRLTQEVEKRDGSRSITTEFKKCRWGLRKNTKKQPALDQLPQKLQSRLRAQRNQGPRTPANASV